MKILSYIFSLLCTCSLVFIISCDKDDDGDKVEMTAQQKAAKGLADGSPWTVTTVVSKPDEDIDETPLLSMEVEFETTGTETTTAPAGFSISMDGDYITSEPNATWAWSGTETSKITLTGASISELKDISFAPNAESPTSVTLTFELTELGGRRNGLGEYTVILE
jgi:hypothetical protein